MHCFYWLALFILLPHTAYAGAWTLAKGHLWGKITGMAQSTNEEYVAVGGAGREPDLNRLYEPGDRAHYRENGHYNSQALFIDLFYGLNDRIDFGIQIPYYRREFENVGFRPTNIASGFGDMRGIAKINIVQNPVVSTIKFGTKAPTGKFQNQDGIISAGEGQWDFELAAQIGRSFWPLPLYANIDLGYRVRRKNSTTDYDPGDEWFLNSEIGYNPIAKLLIILKLEGIKGRPSRVLGLKLPSDIRRITYFAPTLIICPFQNLSFETSVRITAGGRNFPAGYIWTAGISYSGSISKER